MRAVRFDEYGSVEVLRVDEVDTPSPERNEVVIEVVATSINPGEIAIREGAMAEQAPSTFPSGQGSDLAGRISAVGEDVDGWTVGDEVVGWTDDRNAQSEHVAVQADQVVRKPSGVSWEQAGSLYVAGCTAQGMVGAIEAGDGTTVLVAGASGGVGSIAVQLLRHRGARVLGVAGPDNDEWLESVGAEPVNYGEDLQQRLLEVASDGVDAVLDGHGDGYVDLGIELGVPVEQVVTIIDFETAERVGARTLFGYQVASREMLAGLVDLIASGDLDVPIAATFPLEDVRDAYDRLTDGHIRGKIVLRVRP